MDMGWALNRPQLSCSKCRIFSSFYDVCANNRASTTITAKAGTFDKPRTYCSPPLVERKAAKLRMRKKGKPKTYQALNW